MERNRRCKIVWSRQSPRPSLKGIGVNMESKWAVIVVEQDAEDVTAHVCESESDAIDMMHGIWKRDMATEVVESSRKVDFTKSHCLESYAELWYVVGGTPIKYFVQEITDVSTLNENISLLKTTILNDSYGIGDKLASITWSEPVWTTDSLSKTDVEIVAIGDDFIGIMDKNGYANKLTIDKIINIEKGE